jgi:hypothetical protein
MSQVIDSYTVTDEGEKLSGLPTILDTLIGETATDGIELRELIEEVFFPYWEAIELNLGDAKFHPDTNSHILPVIGTFLTPPESRVVAELLIRGGKQRKNQE